MYSPKKLYPLPPSHSRLPNEHKENVAKQFVSANANLNADVGNRFCNSVRDVLNLMLAVLNVDLVQSRALPRWSCRDPGYGPKATGIRLYMNGLQLHCHSRNFWLVWCHSS